ncbi:MAG TPA: OmpH family outer membrane protein [Planctomycetota bacterium]|nr:OmpH family outer membrane protein [Planctomycetota bacterium]
MIQRNVGLTAVGACVVVLLAAHFLAGQANPKRDAKPRTFAPPRIAVVDISQVFELYEKKKDRQAQFQSEIKVVEEKLKELEKKYKDVLSDIQNLEAGPRRREKEREKFDLEQEVKDLNEKEKKRLRETQMRYLKEIRDEIEAEIQILAQAEDLELILEKKVIAETESPNMPGFSWPIVHFVAPEFEITNEIASRLNSRYRP